MGKLCKEKECGAGRGESISKKVKGRKSVQGEGVRNRKGERIEVKRLKAGQLCKEKKRARDRKGIE